MLISTHHTTPIMDSQEYQVHFTDSSFNNYLDNLLIENLYSQVDEYGNIYELLKGIIYHRIMEDTIPKENVCVQLALSAKKWTIKTRGWDLLVEFKEDERHGFPTQN